MDKTPNKLSVRYPRQTTRYGAQVEQSALEWFIVHHPGSRVLARNYRCKAGELDLVLEESLYSDQDGEEPGHSSVELVFVEVRAREQGSWLTGCESIDSRKQRKLIQTIEHFMARYRGAASSARFDVLAWDGSSWTHIPNAWLL